MEQSQKDKWSWLSKHTPSVSDLFWEYLAPGFLIKIRNKFREWRLKHYKMRKVKKSKTKHDTEYFIEFNLVLKDTRNPQQLGPFTIVIPAKAIFFAKRKLKTHINDMVDIDIVTFHSVEDDDEDC